MFDTRARQRGVRAHPRVEQAQARHARVTVLTAVEQRGRGTITQAPQHHPLNAGALALQGVNGHADVFMDGVKRHTLGTAVTQATVVKTQHGETGAGQAARQQHKLPVAAHAVLRPADHHHQT